MPGYVFEFTAHGHGTPANSGNFQYKESIKKSFKVTNATFSFSELSGRPNLFYSVSLGPWGP